MAITNNNPLFLDATSLSWVEHNGGFALRLNTPKGCLYLTKSKPTTNIKNALIVRGDGISSPSTQNNSFSNSSFDFSFNG